MTKKLIVATSNVGKLKEMGDYLQSLDWQLELKPTDLEIEETGTTFLENACLKASEVAKALGEWAIADDSGLAIDALNGSPGVYSARYGQTNEERINRVLTELAQQNNRQAQFICVIAIANPQGEIVLTAEGICQGEILKEVKGVGGFGYDPIFYIPEKQQTFAQMSLAEKQKISHRGLAFQALIPQLQNLKIITDS
jgi:XTP/dITP diphosphohydrolase